MAKTKKTATQLQLQLQTVNKWMPNCPVEFEIKKAKRFACLKLRQLQVALFDCWLLAKLTVGCENCAFFFSFYFIFPDFFWHRFRFRMHLVRLKAQNRPIAMAKTLALSLVLTIWKQQRCTVVTHSCCCDLRKATEAHFVVMSRCHVANVPAAGCRLPVARCQLPV